MKEIYKTIIGWIGKSEIQSPFNTSLRIQLNLGSQQDWSESNWPPIEVACTYRASEEEDLTLAALAIDRIKAAGYEVEKDSAGWVIRLNGKCVLFASTPYELNAFEYGLSQTKTNLNFNLVFKNGQVTIEDVTRIE